jgi:hypothetical protein
VSISELATGAADSVIRNAATSKAQSDLGYPLTTIADHTMVCVPPGTSGGWIAYVSNLPGPTRIEPRKIEGNLQHYLCFEGIRQLLALRLQQSLVHLSLGSNARAR